MRRKTNNSFSLRRMEDWRKKTAHGMGNLGRVVGGSSLGLLGLVCLALIFPSTQNSTEALAVYVGDRTLTPELGLALASLQEWEVNPSAMDGTATTSSELLVSASGAAGYKVYLSGKDGKTSLYSIDSSNTAEIGSIAEEMALASFPANTWGYSLSTDTPTSSTIYQAISSESNTIALEEALGETKVNSYHLNFATKVNSALPAGAYTGGVVVSVVATPWKVHTLSDLTYMQDMTSYVCDYSNEHETKQLIDTRDGKSYWVAKLKDGNCWMTQNLALDLSTEVALTPEDSDVSADWTPSSSTERDIPAKTDNNYTSARSWNLGKIVLTNPTESELCVQDLPADLQALGYAQGGNVSAFYGYELTTQCSWYRNVAELTDGYNATQTSSISLGGRAYDAHYLIGNYYQWEAATAGSGILTNSTNTNSGASTNPARLVDASSSVCPKGWKLPVAGRNTVNTAGWPFDREDSFYKLLRAYGYPETGSSTTDINLEGSRWYTNGGNARTLIDGDGKTRVDYAPIYLVRNGRVHPVMGGLRFAGASGYYWSSTATPASTTNAFNFDFSTTSIYPSGNNPRDFGLAVRCLAK